MIRLRQGFGGPSSSRSSRRSRWSPADASAQVVRALDRRRRCACARHAAVGRGRRRPASAASPEGLTVTARVDRPAIWVADRLTYTVEIVCPRGVDILVDDLARDKLPLTGLDVVERRHAPSRRGRRDPLRVRLRPHDAIASTSTTPAIGPFPVRYYLARAGQRPEEAAPAGSVTSRPSPSRSAACCRTTRPFTTSATDAMSRSAGCLTVSSNRSASDWSSFRLCRRRSSWCGWRWGFASGDAPPPGGPPAGTKQSARAALRRGACDGRRRISRRGARASRAWMRWFASISPTSAASPPRA